MFTGDRVDMEWDIAFALPCVVPTCDCGRLSYR